MYNRSKKMNNFFVIIMVIIGLIVLVAILKSFWFWIGFTLGGFLGYRISKFFLKRYKL